MPMPIWANGLVSRDCGLRKLCLKDSCAGNAIFSGLQKCDQIVDFVAGTGGRLELFAAKWTEIPGNSSTANMGFVRKVVLGLPAGSMVREQAFRRMEEGHAQLVGALHHFGVFHRTSR